MDDITRQLTLQVSQQLPLILHRVLQDGQQPGDLQLVCSLTASSNASRTVRGQVQVAAVNIDERTLSPVQQTRNSYSLSTSTVPGSFCHIEGIQPAHSASRTRSLPVDFSCESDATPSKRQRTNTEAANGFVGSDGAGPPKNIVQHYNKRYPQQKKRIPDNPILQPSTLDKLVNGIWDSLFSGVTTDPTEVIEQWQAIEPSGQPKLLTANNQDSVLETASGLFGRMNVLTRQISQASKTFRSLEVIVQARWIECFDDRVAELSASTTADKAKKQAISEACVDFRWIEKELRNRTAIWRGYNDIKNAGGWAALVFSGPGLYRFCKYRVSFTDEAIQTLRQLRHRFEVAADTLHPRWRIFLGIIGESAARRYTGHLHDWVVNGPGDEAIPLPQTYVQWDRNFTYTHLDDSAIDKEAFWDFDPRMVSVDSTPETYHCQGCGERQSSNPTENRCSCYATMYGSTRPCVPAVQVFRTPSGKNNGLIACCAFEAGAAVGEFVGQITSGLRNMDVMVDRTERGSYQIWQGKQGNHTRFINHSCEPNSYYERFVWLGKQRSVLVSKGMDAGEEITVDYGDVYWKDLDKVCLCGSVNCRYREQGRNHNNRQLITPPNEEHR